MCLIGEVAAATFSGGGDNGDGRDVANSQRRGGCCDSLSVVVTTNSLWRSSVGGSCRRGNRLPHTQRRNADFLIQSSVLTTVIKDDWNWCGMS